MKKYKIIFADLDGTLIKTKSGETFPKGIWDMEIRFEVLDALKKAKPLALLIASNQGGIEAGIVNRRDFTFKMEYLIRSIRAYTDLITEYSYCTSNNKDNPYRKPNAGMLDSLLFKAQHKWLKGEDITYDVDCLMIGDASGGEGSQSDTDRKTAENFGCDYLDVEDFCKGLRY